LQQIIEGVSGVGRVIAKKASGCLKEDFIVCCSDSETVINSLPGYD
jgi:hypothetical protein